MSRLIYYKPFDPVNEILDYILEVWSTLYDGHEIADHAPT